MLTIEMLKEYGADTDTALGRCFGNEAFYFRLVGMASASAEFDKLSEAVEKGDLQDAFNQAHALKGILGNLSLTPAYDKVCEITELLRAGTQMDYSERVAQILEERDKIAEMCR